jgi:mono/diheme cytochrome c family protein
MSRPFQSVVCVLSVAILGLTGCGPLPGRPTAADVPIAPNEVTAFAELYRENCAGCHGRDGKGNGALALANPVYLAIAGDEAIHKATAQGVNGTLMPPFAQSAGGTLTEAQIDILVHGIRTNWSRANSLGGVTPPPYAAASAGNAQRGAEVNAVFCAPCHGPNGQGTAKAGSVVDVSYLALVSDQGLRTTVIAGRPDLGHPDWRNCVSNRVMSAQEVTDVVAWMASHRSPTPGQPYASNP